ncbi:hypothetical protein ACGF1Z_33175 [Streptomyces sp. NPDC048018]|uniref:hypothetical protein n=1 Tax=Streptomyces sp. NPDC048018 TaxID=3365499 RepID=UPI00371687E6
MSAGPPPIGRYAEGWRPGPVSAVDPLPAGPVAALSAVLDLPGPVAADGGELPPLWHWLYFLDWPAGRELGPDGHPAHGHFLPPVPARQRMWAGGRCAITAPLRLGEPAERVASLGEVTARRGRSGDLLFVTERREFRQGGRLCLMEEQDIVYRSGPATPSGSRQAAPADASLTGASPEDLPQGGASPANASPDRAVPEGAVPDRAVPEGVSSAGAFRAGAGASSGDVASRNGAPPDVAPPDVAPRAVAPPSVAPPAGPPVAPPEGRAGDGGPPGTGDPWRLALCPGPTLLFRFSALTANAHRIHYDADYCRDEEDRPGLVVHGPLLALLMLDVVRRHAPERRVRSLAYRLRRPVYADEPLTVGGGPAGEGALLRVATGREPRHATAEVRFA